MAISCLLSFIFLIIFVDGQCLDHQKNMLLDLKSELVFNSPLSQHLVTWNQTYDCCKWGGVECDGAGRVVGLRLTNEGITGGISESSTLFRLTHLSFLSLGGNDFVSSQIPQRIHRLTNLRHLDLSRSGFMGSIPSTLSSLTNLVYLDLSVNSLTGSLPTFHLCTKLVIIDIGFNHLMGSLSHLDFGSLANLSSLVLDRNSLNGSISRRLFLLPSVNHVSLAYNKFSGQIEEFPRVNNLVWLDLSNNRINGPLPSSFLLLRNIRVLLLSDNLLDGTFQLQKLQSLPKLMVLDLSYNNLSIDTANLSSNSGGFGFPQFHKLHLASCNLYEFPNLRNQSYLESLDLSNNHIRGDIPSWIWGLEMSYLNLSFNLLTGMEQPRYIPASVSYLDLQSNMLSVVLFSLIPTSRNLSYSVILLANNRLTGVVPTSICNASSLRALDLSFNNLSGSIPPCLIKENLVSEVLNLRGNKISGVIPDRFSSECGLQTFDVSNNNLGGKVPKSLANCKKLLVMNVGNNNLEDSFPCMLPLSLRILLLRSNRFHGDLRCGKSWPDLQILDISSNNFSGTVNLLNFSSLRGMMLRSPTYLRLNRSNSNFLGADSFYHNEVTLTVKGIEVKLVKIWPDFTSIDLSSNRFEGEITGAVGNLSSLYLLNLSHNSLTDAIPKSLGDLTELGSLDLSVNMLTGSIPWELTKLTFLSILNVSYNNLTGMIPTGHQFQTFSADLFEGNTRLCGFPLDRSCSSPHGPGSTPSEPKDEEIEWEYVFAATGYVVGLGSIAWSLFCCRSFRGRYFEKIEEVVDKIFYERGRRRRHERRIRRREDRINGVRRRHQ
ncbi:receptor-like protein 32 [Salvia divinorum]|uniref:Receptor-like protein 32 n=1 Tax=Salvia divinorum TaxID=28513 RepID=A0ABD1GHD1_SALDI